MINTNRFLSNAMKVAHMGYPVFPIKERKKAPYETGGFKTASRDIDQIRRWAALYPNANIGVPTGAVSGITVVDVDGEEGIDSMRTAFPKGHPLTRTHHTARDKGWHLIYSYDP